MKNDSPIELSFIDSAIVLVKRYWTDGEMSTLAASCGRALNFHSVVFYSVFRYVLMTAIVCSDALHSVVMQGRQQMLQLARLEGLHGFSVRQCRSKTKRTVRMPTRFLPPPSQLIGKNSDRCYMLGRRQDFSLMFSQVCHAINAGSEIAGALDAYPSVVAGSDASIRKFRPQNEIGRSQQKLSILI